MKRISSANNQCSTQNQTDTWIDINESGKTDSLHTQTDTDRVKGIQPFPAHQHNTKKLLNIPRACLQ